MNEDKFNEIMAAPFVKGDEVIVSNPQSTVDGRVGQVDCVKDSVAHVRIDKTLHFIQTKYLLLNGAKNHVTTSRKND